MEKITIYDADCKTQLKLSEITLGQIFDYEIVIIDGSIFRNTDMLDSLSDSDVMTLLGVSNLMNYNYRPFYELRSDFSKVINDAKDNGQIVILLEEGTDTKYPKICTNGLIDRKTFWGTVKILNELRELLDF